MEKKAAKQRVAALKTDTDRLLKLSLELKEYVDKSDENVLSLDVIKKAEAIEKLAKSVPRKNERPKLKYENNVSTIATQKEKRHPHGMAFLIRITLSFLT